MRVNAIRRPLLAGVLSLACLAAPARAERRVPGPVLRTGTPPAGERVASALAARPLHRIGGGALRSDEFRDQVVVLSFWASWCGPCRRELPRLVALHEELARSGGRVVAVSIDADVRNAADFARRYAPALPVYHDGPDGLARALDLPALPYTLVLGRDGGVVWAGGGSDEPTLRELGERARRAAATAPRAGPTEGDE